MVSTCHVAFTHHPSMGAQVVPSFHYSELCCCGRGWTRICLSLCFGCLGCDPRGLVAFGLLIHLSVPCQICLLERKLGQEQLLWRSISSVFGSLLGP